MHVHIANCCFTSAGQSNICRKPNTASHYHNYNINRIIVFRYTFYGCCTYMDHSSRCLTVTILKTSIPRRFLPSNHRHFRVAHSIIERKLQLFYCYIVLCTYVENRWFEEKWVILIFLYIPVMYT